jgi:peptidoglycan hydrolase-like protein with peptidoglycan-binding domain
VLGAALATLAFAVPAFAAQHLGERVLRPGMTGHDVRVLQDFLTRAGFATPVGGWFGPITEGNVKRFERRFHFRANGIVTLPVVRKLRAAVAGASSSTAQTVAQAVTGGVAHDGGSQHLGERVLRQGMSGHDVRVLQGYLTSAGYATTVDGQFGAGTAVNVSAFESGHGFKADGVVSFAVADALRRAVASGQQPSSQTVPVSTTSAPTGTGRLNADGTASAPAGAPAAIVQLFAAANQIATDPYCYGGGHGSWTDTCYDCSGSVSYALHGAGLLSSPLDSTELESYGSPGAGHWITIWANSGHTYMYMAGLRFDTSAQHSTGGSRWTTASRSNSGYVERHPTGW